jgi:hypothetical protein
MAFVSPGPALLRLRGGDDPTRDDEDEFDRRHSEEENPSGMPRVRVAVLVLALSLCAGCGGSDETKERQATTTTSQATTTERTTTEATTTEASQPQQDAGDFMKEVINQSILGQFGRSWETLYPSHQAVASRSEYVDCESRNQNFQGFDKVEVVDQYEEPTRIPGETKDTPSTAVTIRLTVSGPGYDKPQTVNSTVHAIPLNGEWRWTLPTEDYRAYKANRCPSAD